MSDFNKNIFITQSFILLYLQQLLFGMCYTDRK